MNRPVNYLILGVIVGLIVVACGCTRPSFYTYDYCLESEMQFVGMMTIPVDDKGTVVVIPQWSDVCIKFERRCWDRDAQRDTKMNKCEMAA